MTLCDNFVLENEIFKNEHYPFFFKMFYKTVVKREMSYFSFSHNIL